MLTINKIKEYCIDIDMQNIDAGDKSIGAYIGSRFLQFRDLHDVELFYSNISLKELLTIYSQYNGLECYRFDEPKEYSKDYNLDIIEIINELNK